MAENSTHFMQKIIAGDFWVRLLSAAVLVPVGLYVAWSGGFLALGFVALIGVLMWWEWNLITRAGVLDAAFFVRGFTLLVVCAAVMFGYLQIAFLFFIGFILLAVLGFFVPMVARWIDPWRSSGTAYALAFIVPTLLLRESPQWGLSAILFLFVIVWTTDSVAYLSGRALGGALLWPAISPKKTWAGFLGGTFGAMAAAVIFALLMNLSSLWILVVLAGFLSVVSSAGDLYESWIKRRFGVKDSSGLIPGHGGLMDRFDGYVAVASVALLIGLWRAGFANPAVGLLQW